MKKAVLTGVILLVFSACHKQETGDPPVGTGNRAPTFTFEADALGPSQIQLSWDPAADDLFASTDLRYGIWYSASGMIDLNMATFITEENAVSFTLNGLIPNTTYTVLVRAFDSANYSANTTEIEVTTCPETDMCTVSLFNRELVDSIEDDTPTGLIKGSAFQTGKDDIGVIQGARLDWYKYDSGSWTKSLTGNFPPLETIEEAHLVKTRDSVDELFVIKGNELFFYSNTIANSFDRTNFFQGFESDPPQSGSLDFVLNNLGVLEVMSYVGADQDVYFYERGGDTSGSDEYMLPLGNYRTLTGNSVNARLGHCNNDEYLDLVYLDDNELFFVPGEEKESGSDNLKFGDKVVVDTIEDFSVPVKYLDAGTVKDDVLQVTFNGANLKSTMAVFDLDGGKNADIHIFFRDEMGGVTQLFIYKASDGNFENLTPETIVDYNQATYDQVSFADVDDNGIPDSLVAIQTASNNIAVFPSTTKFSGPANFYGYNGTVPDGTGTDFPYPLRTKSIDYAVFAILGGNTEKDLVMISERVLGTLIDK